MQNWIVVLTPLRLWLVLIKSCLHIETVHVKHISGKGLLMVQTDLEVLCRKALMGWIGNMEQGRPESIQYLPAAIWQHFVMIISMSIRKDF